MNSYRQNIEPISGQQIELVKGTIAKLKFEEFAPRYYHLLFQEYPEFRGRYTQDLVETAARYLGLLEFSVRSFEESTPGNYHFHAAILDPLRNLGARHATLGIMEEHYQCAINIFIEALRQELTGAWSSEVEGSWRHLFLHITYWMNQKTK